MALKPINARLFSLFLLLLPMLLIWTVYNVLRMSLEMDLMSPFLLRQTAAVSNVHVNVTSLNRVQFDRPAMSMVRSIIAMVSVYVRSKNKLEMWANAQRDGRPAEYRWRPLFNAAVWLTPTSSVPCSNAAKTRFFASFLCPVFPASRVQSISDLHSKFALRPHHVWMYGRHRVCDR